MHHTGLNRFLAGIAILAGFALAQQPPQPQPLTVHVLKEGSVYWIEGGGGNTGVIIGQNGVVIVDAKTTPDAGKQVIAEVAKLTPKPITHAIITHSDGDHVNGLAAFPDGLIIIAHENNKKEQQTALAAGGRGAPPANRLPTQVVTKEKDEMKLDGINFTLLHWAPAHTSGDLVVFLPDQKIVFTGDVISTQRPDPNIHPEKNGSSEGWVKSVKGIVALNADSFVPGHGDLQTRALVEKRLADTEEKRNKIVAMVKQGKSQAEIKEAVGEGAPAAAGKGGPQVTFTDIVVQELTKK